MARPISNASKRRQGGLYLFDMHDRMKRSRVFHVNMLKAFHIRTEAVGYMEEDVMQEGVEKECFAIKLAVTAFRVYLHGQK